MSNSGGREEEGRVDGVEGGGEVRGVGRGRGEVGSIGNEPSQVGTLCKRVQSKQPRCFLDVATRN